MWRSWNRSPCAAGIAAAKRVSRYGIDRTGEILSVEGGGRTHVEHSIGKTSASKDCPRDLPATDERLRTVPTQCHLERKVPYIAHAGRMANIVFGGTVRGAQVTRILWLQRTGAAV